MAAPAPSPTSAAVPDAGPERYVTRRELAALMGVSIDTVDRLVSRRDAVRDVGETDPPLPTIGRDRVGGRARADAMSISRLPSGRWRAQVYDPASKRNISVSRVLGGAGHLQDEGRGEAREGEGARAASRASTRAR